MFEIHFYVFCPFKRQPPKLVKHTQTIRRLWCGMSKTRTFSQELFRGFVYPSINVELSQILGISKISYLQRVIHGVLVVHLYLRIS